MRMFVLVFLVSLGLVGTALADDFDWRAHEGEKLNLLLNQHPYQEAMVANLDAFTELTGIDVTFDVFPEQNYFEKVTIDLSSGRRSSYDVFMTGAYMIWQYAPAGWMEPLEDYISDSSKTHADYDFEDIFEDLRVSTSWNLEPGRENLGKGSQYAIPLGFETNALMYRADIFEEKGLSPPESLDALVELSKSLSSDEMAGIVVRGSRNWATIHPGYMTMYASAGCVDYDENMVPQMNSPCAVEVTEKWVDMVKEAGPEAWTTYTWYQAGTDFGAGEAAMLFDADILGFFNNQDTAVAGNIAWAPGPRGDDGALRTNIWIWSLAMNANSKVKDAAWYFMQWATGKEFLTQGATDAQFAIVDPVRTSIWENAAFQERLTTQIDYLDTFNTIMENDAKIQFTPQPLFFETTTEWAAKLQEIYGGSLSAQEGLDQLVEELTELLEIEGLIQ